MMSGGKTLKERSARIPGSGNRLAGRAVMIVDDVMTSGATLRATAMAAKEAGAEKVSVLVLARVVKDG